MGGAIMKKKSSVTKNRNKASANLFKLAGGYTVTNRFSDRMLPEKKKTTRIT